LAAAIAGGTSLVEPPAPPPPSPREDLLSALDADRRIRAVVGRLDVSGASDAAAWATVAEADGRTVLEIHYRHGREVLQELAQAAEDVIIGEGWTIRRL